MQLPPNLTYQRLRKLYKTIPLLTTSYMFSNILFPSNHAMFWAFATVFMTVLVILRFYFLGNTYVSNGLTLVFILVIIGNVLSIIRDLQSNMSTNISKKLYGQPQAIHTFIKAHEKKKNLFVLVGPSAVGKTMLADLVAKEFQLYHQDNMYCIRLSDFSPKHVTKYLHDIEQLFNKQNRNSIGYFVEVQCKAPGCVVLLDDFHIFSGLRFNESVELFRRLDNYAHEHKEAIFMVVIETSSVLSKQVLGIASNRAPASYGMEGESTEKLKATEEQLNGYLAELSATNGGKVDEINRIIRQRVPALDQSHNYTLVPFSPLSMKMVDWQHVLTWAVKQKLVDGALKTLTVLRRPHLYIEFSPEIVNLIVQTAFSKEGSEGMRSFNNNWLPLILETIKYTCPHTCSAWQELHIDTNGREWTCECRSLSSIFQGLQSLFSWMLCWAKANDPFLDKVRGLLQFMFS